MLDHRAGNRWRVYQTDDPDAEYASLVVPFLDGYPHLIESPLCGCDPKVQVARIDVASRRVWKVLVHNSADGR